MPGSSPDESDRISVRWGGDDGDGIGQLTVDASAHGFAGRSAAWFNRQEVIDFAGSLDAYPLPDRELEMWGGFGATDGRPAQEHVGLRVAAAGRRGQIGVRVHLATEVWPETRPEARHDVLVELLTTYERLRAFSRDLRHVVDGTIDEAEIGGGTLAG